MQPTVRGAAQVERGARNAPSLAEVMPLLAPIARSRLPAQGMISSTEDVREIGSSAWTRCECEVQRRCGQAV